MPKPKESEPEAKRVNINIPVNLHNRFKAAAAAQGENMTDILMKFIEAYVNNNGVEPKKRSRR